MDIDVDKLREDLENYYTSAMFIASPVALMDVVNVNNAKDEELIEIAIKNGFDLNKYKVSNDYFDKKLY